MSLLEHRRKIAQEIKSQMPPTLSQSMEIEPGAELDIADKLERQLKSAEKNELEDFPRTTVLKMLIEKQLDEPFTFKVTLGQGAAYVQAMRQVLSRTRHKALKQKRPLQEFKVYVIKIQSEADYDSVTLLRTRRMSLEEESVYDELIAQFEKKPLK